MSADNYQVFHTESDTEERNGLVKAWIEGVHVDENALAQAQHLSQLPFIHKHVALMPDVHLGKGATIGSVIATKGAIVPAAVGVDLGCFTGDTEVQLISDRSLPIQDLVGQRVITFGCADNGDVKVVTAEAKKTRENASLVRVKLDHGESFRCTPDHLVMCRDGSYTRADELVAGQSLMPFRAARDKDKYILVRNNRTQNSMREHWMIARAGLLGAIPSGLGKLVIHHKNHVPWINEPENLEFMDQTEHSRLHRLSGKGFQHLNGDVDFQKRRADAIKSYWQNISPEELERKKEIATANIRKYMDERPDEFKRTVAGNGVRGAPHLVKYNKSPETIERNKVRVNTSLPCHVCGEMTKQGVALIRHFKAKHREYFYKNPDTGQLKLKEGYSISPNNHKVVAVEVLDEREDVYCLTVNDECHNFALKVGVFVHNCGMDAVRLNLTAEDIDDNMPSKIRAEIESRVPVGNANRSNNQVTKTERKVWKGADLDVDLQPVADDIGLTIKQVNKGLDQLGTLGGGNHFIELCFDENNDVWIMLHSGSRGLGNIIGTQYIQRAKDDMRRHFINLPDKDLAYLVEGSEHYNGYVRAVGWAQRYAYANRAAMMTHVIEAVQYVMGERQVKATDKTVSCHHNYIEMENHFKQNVWVTRKGAVRARKRDRGIIPGSMGAKSYIVRGKGNPDSFNSCSHGAGRVMSRTQAKKRFNRKDLEAATIGVDCPKTDSVVDEIPMAYKDIDAVMNAQKDLVSIEHELKQFVCVKG